MKSRKPSIDKYLAKLFRTSRNKPVFQVFLFLLRFNLLAIPMYIVILSGFQWTFLNQATEDIVFNMLLASNVPVEKTGQFITVPVESGSFAGSVDWDCTGWKSMYALFALIFATSLALRKKLYGLVFIPIVYLINLVRIWFMFWFVYNYGVTYYSIVHATIWSWGLIATIIALWLIWIKLPICSKKRGKRK